MLLSAMPMTSARRRNSSHSGPMTAAILAVKSQANSHSGSVSRTSLTRACRCLIKVATISRRRGSAICEYARTARSVIRSPVLRSEMTYLG